MRGETIRRRGLILGGQLAILVTFLVAWEALPTVGWLDPFFVSQPSRVAKRLLDLLTGTGGAFLWPYVWPTVSASLAGLVIGVVFGGLFGLALGSSPLISDLLRPFVIALNAVPRIALIPIIVLIAGPTYQAAVMVSVLVVFFVAFFNAYEGARSVAPHLIQNAVVFGSSRWDVMRHIRFPYALAWTLAAVPIAATFALLSIVTGEVMTGSMGMGRLLMVAVTSADSSLTFAVVIVLSVLGVSIVGLIGQGKRKLMHWWTAG